MSVFVCFGICLIPYTSAYKSSEVGYWKLMEIDESCLEWARACPWQRSRSIRYWARTYR